MAIRDTWRRALEYFGLVEGDYIEEGEYDEHDTGTELALEDAAVAPREAASVSPLRGSRGATAVSSRAISWPVSPSTYSPSSM